MENYIIAIIVVTGIILLISFSRVGIFDKILDKIKGIRKNLSSNHQKVILYLGNVNQSQIDLKNQSEEQFAEFKNLLLEKINSLKNQLDRSDTRLQVILCGSGFTKTTLMNLSDAGDLDTIRDMVEEGYLDFVEEDEICEIGMAFCGDIIKTQIERDYLGLSGDYVVDMDYLYDVLKMPHNDIIDDKTNDTIERHLERFAKDVDEAYNDNLTLDEEAAYAEAYEKDFDEALEDNAKRDAAAEEDAEKTDEDKASEESNE